MSQKTIQIVDGPSKFDLMIALFHKPEGGHGHQPLAFKLEDGRTIPVILRGVTMEDGSHESWILTGYIMNGGDEFDAYFSTKRRRGAWTIDG